VKTNLFKKLMARGGRGNYRIEVSWFLCFEQNVVCIHIGENENNRNAMDCSAKLVEIILSRVLVTNNEGSGLDERVYLRLIHTTNNYT
jgi:hypothetical protein